MLWGAGTNRLEEPVDNFIKHFSEFKRYVQAFFGEGSLTRFPGGYSKKGQCLKQLYGILEHFSDWRFER